MHSECSYVVQHLKCSSETDFSAPKKNVFVNYNVMEPMYLKCMVRYPKYQAEKKLVKTTRLDQTTVY